MERCRVNSVGNPYFTKDDKKKPGKCRDGREKCKDWYYGHSHDIGPLYNAGNHGSALGFAGEWFWIRRSLEEAQLPDLGSYRGVPAQDIPWLLQHTHHSSGHIIYMQNSIALSGTTFRFRRSLAVWARRGAISRHALELDVWCPHISSLDVGLMC